MKLMPAAVTCVDATKVIGRSNRRQWHEKGISTLHISRSMILTSATNYDQLIFGEAEVPPFIFVFCSL